MGIGSWTPCLLIVSVRLLGAATNIIHDCDEVYNYWEPLHYLFYGYGKQTWEYSAEFGLRSYLYLLLHWLMGLPVRLVTGNGRSKLAVFYAVRLALAGISATLELKLINAMKRIYPQAAWYLSIMLAFSSGMFSAATSFLPSTFAMYSLMAASVGVVTRSAKIVIISAVIGVVVGWPVAGVAFLPFAFFILLQPRLMQSFAILGASLLLATTALVGADTYFYGNFMGSLSKSERSSRLQQASQWNFIKYNVLGGGQSHLFGVEPFNAYIFIGLLSHNIAFVLALSLPQVGVVKWAMHKFSIGSGSKDKSISDKVLVRLALVCAPVYVWLYAISMLPHKEERFLYVVYPQICWAGAVLLASSQKASSRVLGIKSAKLLARSILLAYCLISVLRTLALIQFYGAPMQAYTHLPVTVEGSTKHINVCVGDEWERYPSSFFLPSSQHRLQYLKQNFAGLLPTDFDPTQGTRTAPPMLNNKNDPAPSLFLESIKNCDYVIDLELPGQEHLIERNPHAEWESLVEIPFVKNSLSPMLYRVLYIPWMSNHQNYFGMYKLYRQIL